MRAAARSSIASGYRTIGKSQAVSIRLLPGFGQRDARMSNTQTHQFVIVQETAPRDAGLPGPIPSGLVGLQLESLILAQNERWRHA